MAHPRLIAAARVFSRQEEKKTLIPAFSRRREKELSKYLRLCEGEQIPISLKHIRVDFMILYEDTEPFLELGQKPRHRHRIEFGQGSEQRRRVREAGNLVGAEPQHVGQCRAQSFVDGFGIAKGHLSSPGLEQAPPSGFGPCALEGEGWRLLIPIRARSII